MTVGSFDDLAEAYERGRPTYAPEAIDWAAKKLSLSAEMTVADLGAGTGILTRVLLERFLHVWAVDPSAPMLARLPPSASLTTRLGTAESTSLPETSLDAIFTGQALHWFDPVRSVAEWRRISRGPVQCVAMWNDRRLEGTAGTISQLVDAAAGATQSKLAHRGPARSVLLSRFAEAGLPAVAESSFASPSVLDVENAPSFLRSISYLPPRESEVFERLENEVLRLLETTGPLQLWDTHVFVLSEA